MSRIRLALVEDSSLLREGLVSMIARHDDFEIVADAGDTDAGALAMLSLGIDVLLVDFELPRDECLRLLHRVRRRHARTAVVLLNVPHQAAHVLGFVQAGVAGFILKDEPLNSCLTTIRAVACGAKVLPSGLTAALFSEICRSGQRRRQPDTSRMTRREREIAALISAGLSNKEIAAQLRIATHTVKSHVHNLFEKLDVNGRAELASYVARVSLQSPPSHR